MYRIYRLLLALYAMIQVFNFLLIASNHLPSLGILIETISASKEDLFMFFCFSQLIFVMAVVGSILGFLRRGNTYLYFLCLDAMCEQLSCPPQLQSSSTTSSCISTHSPE